MAALSTIEADSKLSELLSRMDSGERITVTRDGEAVAELMLVWKQTSEARSAAANIRKMREGNLLAGLTLRDLIEEGRR